MIVAYLRISSGGFQRSLHHCTRVANIEREGRVPSAARVLRTEIRPFAIVIESAWVLRIDQPSVLLLYQLLHHREHVDLAFINEHFGVTLVNLLHLYIAEMHMVDAIPGREPPAHLHRVSAHLPCHPAIECNPVRRAVHDAYQFLPAFDRSHDLLGPTADRRGGIVWMQRETHAGLLGLRNNSL